MVGQNPYAQYNNSKILTASPAELTLMLYDGAIKFCNIAIMGIEKNEQYCVWAQIRLEAAETDALIQGYEDGVFWERNTSAYIKKRR